MGDQLETGVLNRKPGQRGHDPRLCWLLATRIRQVAAKHGVKPADLRWINSGDLTRTGDTAEFAVVRDFMETVPQRDRLGRPLRPTLGLSRNRYVEVPGNHDHWQGWDEGSLRAQVFKNPPPAWNPSLFPNVFETTPWDNLAAPWVSSGGSFHLGERT